MGVSRRVSKSFRRRGQRAPTQLGQGLILPSKNRVAYLKAPNSGSDYLLDVSVYPAVGDGVFFTNSTTPIAATAAQINGLAGINQYHILFYAGKLVIYDPYTVADATIVKADKCLKQALYDSTPTAYFNGVSIAGSTSFDSGTLGTNPGQWVLGNQGLPGDPMTLVNAGVDVPAIEGARLEWVPSGVELIVNGGFDDATGWSVAAPSEIVSGRAKVKSIDGNSYPIDRGLTGAVAGKRFRIIATVDHVSGETKIQTGSGGLNFITFSVAGIYSVNQDVLWDGTNNRILLTRRTGNCETYFDNISIQELLPTWRTTYTDGTPILPTTTQLTRTSTTVLDGSELGLELITVAADRDFSSDTGFWARESNWTLSGGAFNSNGLTSGSVAKGGLLVGNKTYSLTITITNYISGTLDIFAFDSPHITLPASNGTYSILFNSLSTGTTLYMRGALFNGSIDNISIKEVLPAFTSTFLPSTTYAAYDRSNPLLMPGFLSEPARTNILYNSLLVGGATPTSWTFVFSTGSASYATSNVCAEAISFTFTAAAQRSVLNQTRTVSISSTYTYSCEIESITGSITAGDIASLTGTLNASVITYPACSANPSGGASGVCTTGTLVIQIVTDALTTSVTFRYGIGCSANATGSVKLSRPQVELGAFKTSFMGSPPAAGITRAGTVSSWPTLGKIRSNNIAFRLTVVPRASGQEGVSIYSSYTDASNYTAFVIGSTVALFRKQVAGVNTDASVSITHTKDVPIQIVAYSDTNIGMQIAFRQYTGGSWSSWTNGTKINSAAGKANSVVASTYQLGSRNSILQFTGNISSLQTLLIPSGITDPLVWAKAQWGIA